jgi:peptidoglycan/xylan/chitin deacetylase (PgdA/CDA1 family)
LLRVSVIVHCAAAVALLAVPAQALWVLAVLVCNHLIITVCGLSPRSTALGHNLVRLPAASIARREVALTIDDGPDPEVTPAVLDLLDAAGVRATFFCIANQAQAHPELLRQIELRGHSVQNHTQNHHLHFSLLGPRGFEREISAAQATLAGLTGVTPTLFRAPAGFRNPFLGPVLHRQGLTLTSWTRRSYDTRIADAAQVLAGLTRGLAAGDILLLHDGNAARMADGRPVILAVLPALLAACKQAELKLVTLPEALREIG